MGTLQVKAIQHSGADCRAQIVSPSGRVRDIFVESNIEMTREATPWLAATVPVSMRSGASLRIDGQVDALAVSNSHRASALMAGWFKELKPLEGISCDPAPKPLPPAEGVGCLFSGGVDSFYSVLRNRDRISHLIFVSGFDIALTDEELIARTLRELRQAASALALPLVEIRTNLKSLGDEESLLWGKHYHGAALGAIAQFLAPTIGTVIVPSSYSFADLHPWGSHPELDPLWSSARVTLEHDGVEKTRPEKVSLLSKHQVALDHLRVCYRNPEGAYNCGKCEKCIRTIINLRVVGAVGRCRTLPANVTPEQLRELRVDTGGALFVHENLSELRRQGRTDPELVAALERSLRVSRFHSFKTRSKDWVKLALRR
ncbi:hypothetical protein [Nocardioides campestrisoli]|uniref:hypothetical protein n=1 Tax=Nocardioides campestrisoli TaxID=2736757 RepID=UPI0015E6DDD3|nr:hypothetical protein [Nocardioides campestrisoli]